MRGFLALEPDRPSHAALVDVQNRLHTAIARQGVHFVEPERLHIPILTWPFASLEELDEAPTLINLGEVPQVTLSGLTGRPSTDRPGEFGFAAEGLDAISTGLFEALRKLLDPDRIESKFLRLARVSPASRKVGIAFSHAGLISTQIAFTPSALSIWRQTASGFECHRRLDLT